MPKKLIPLIVLIVAWNSFQKVESEISSEWTVGQVESITRNKDRKIRRIEIRYFNHGQETERKTERCVRNIVRLFNVEDDYFVSDMERVEVLVKELEKGDNDKSLPEAEELEVTEDESLRVNVDNDGEEEIVDKFAHKNCKCCCVSHCNLTAHAASTGVVYGVNLAKYVVVPAVSEMQMPYTREKVSPGDTMIRPTVALESVDEMYESLTALQTDFSIL